MKAIDIVIIVDVIGALSKRTLQNDLYMVDDSWNSRGKGAANLSTTCYPGQLLRWVAYAIDVQTPVTISGIAFLNTENTSSARELLAMPGSGAVAQAAFWTGIVPSDLPPGLHGYSLKLQMGSGRNSVMSVDTPTLNVLPPLFGLEQRDEPTTGNHSDDR
jgi:hypothetical protein